MMQIGGGRLADTYGGKIVLGMGVLIWSLFTLITPWAAMGGLNDALPCQNRHGAWVRR